MQRVLQSVAFSLPEISYCQGMNFIASVIIAEAGEENAFYIMMYLLVKHELKTLFLPVSFFYNFIGISRVAPEEFLNGLTDQVSFA